ncbi:SoxR reducing system RseC family protein [Maribacter sp. HTCC2170]|uniref:SoxR reducing system RseC family protein n=1 Tax=Maribacter sp. (strain HTCC2170 / KCCM 42371) TaxID=313603 RepID=UPI00006B4957|nr:SoxR reducing system RseC family protein [Maribacter sp. HTCC2170]EAR01122.1 ferredoxin [Maribacter sp. HTCC2170]
MEDIEIEHYGTVAGAMVEHDGVISKISNNKITVALKGNINCDGCKAKAVCGAADSNGKEIEVDNVSQQLDLNEDVTVLLKKNLAIKAVFLAYILPFIFLLLTLLLASNYFEEWFAGLLALAILLPYYLIIYALRGSFKKEFKVSILKTTQL